MKSERAVTCAIAVAWGLVIAVGAYAVVRAIQRVVYPDPNPAALVWSAHAGFFWRAWTVSYLGGIAAFVAFFVARGRTAAAARALAPAIAIAAGLLALQSAFLP
ncbi:MAG TPA: hypothetical protein VK762_11440 [Polyangiaceae bacterium]|nr:hypothetical protein [Polyangiaceae bacterium]